MLNDLRYGFRMFLKSPGFTAIAVLTLTLGIGANTAIFSVVHATLRPLPYSNAHQLLMVWENDRQEGNDRNPVAPANFADWKAHNSVFQQMGFFSQPGGVNVTGQDEPERIESILVSVDLFPLLGVKPIYGRTF